MLYLCYLCRFKPLRHYLRGFLIAAWAGDKIAEFSFPEISFHFPLRPWFFFVSPAYAGKSSCLWWRKWPCRDHPRVCGEKLNTHLTFPPSSGSPPRMRGKEASRKLRGTLKGITPAYAGKSQCNSSCTAGKWDHPRVCGEKPRQDSVGALEGRITPACAGKSSVRQRVLLSLWDHPRMCGEKTGFGKSAFTKSGSPPHVRGKD